MKKGFTLIELLIVIVITAILVMVAYPSYRDYIVKARRTDGQTAVMDLANRMERYYSNNHTYQTATIGTGNATDVRSSNQSPEGWYTLSIASSDAGNYSLLATPNGAQGTNDTLCQSLTLNSVGVKGIASGPAGSPTGTAARCW